MIFLDMWTIPSINRLFRWLIPVFIFGFSVSPAFAYIPDGSFYSGLNTCCSAAPADATGYLMGFIQSTLGTGNPPGGELLIQQSGTITDFQIDFFVGGTFPTQEAGTLDIYVNDVFALNLSTNIVLGASPLRNNYYRFSGLSLPVLAGDKISLRYLTPTWATNPTTMTISSGFWVANSGTVIQSLTTMLQPFYVFLGIFLLFIVFALTTWLLTVHYA